MTAASDRRCPACDVPVALVHECTERWEDEFGMKGYETTRCEVGPGGAMSVSVSGGSSDAMEELFSGAAADPAAIPEAER